MQSSGYSCPAPRQSRNGRVSSTGMPRRPATAQPQAEHRPPDTPDSRSHRAPAPGREPLVVTQRLLAHARSLCEVPIRTPGTVNPAPGARSSGIAACLRTTSARRTRGAAARQCRGAFRRPHTLRRTRRGPRHLPHRRAHGRQTRRPPTPTPSARSPARHPALRRSDRGVRLHARRCVRQARAAAGASSSGAISSTGRGAEK